MFKLTIKVPIYKANVYVTIAPEIHKVINTFVKKKKWDTLILAEGDEFHGMAITANNTTDYYIFYDILSTNANYINHEISHLIDDILKERGVETIGEARAYLTGFISEKIFDFLLKKGIFISKYLPKKEESKPEIKKEDEKPS
jgi:hypothetical protein